MGQSSVSCKHNTIESRQPNKVKSALWSFQAIATQTSHQTLSISTSSSPSIQSKPSLKKKFPNKSTILQYFHHTPRFCLFLRNIFLPEPPRFSRFLFVFVFSNRSRCIAFRMFIIVSGYEKDCNAATSPPGKVAYS